MTLHHLRAYHLSLDAVLATFEALGWKSAPADSYEARIIIPCQCWIDFPLLLQVRAVPSIEIEFVPLHLGYF